MCAKASGTFVKNGGYCLEEGTEMNGLRPRTAAKTSRRMEFERWEVAAKLPCTAIMLPPHLSHRQAGYRGFGAV